MSITKNMIEINNSESSNEESDKNSLFLQTNDWLKSFFYSMDLSYLMDWIKIGIFLLLWILFSTLSIKESLKCENKITFTILSLIPILNVIMYLSIDKLCKITNRNGVGNYVKSENVYPSIIYKNLNKPNTNSNKYSNNFSKKPNKESNVFNKRVF